MARLWSNLRLALLTLVVLLGSACFAKPAEASHFRYGHVTWRRSRKNTAQFTVTVAFQRSAFIGTARDGFLAVGDRFFDNVGITTFEYGDGGTIGGFSGTPLQFVAVAIDPVKDYVIARGLDPNTLKDRIEHAYAGPNDAGLPWRARVFSCCRIFNLQNNSSGSYQVQTNVDLNKNTFSAVSSLPPIIPVPVTGTSFLIPGVDNDRGTQLAFRLATSTEASGDPLGFVQPPGVTVDSQTGVFTVPPGLAPGLYSTHVIIEEQDAKGDPVGQVGLDFIFEVLATINTAPPAFDYPPTPDNDPSNVLVVIPGTSVNFTVQARDPDGDAVLLNTTGIPQGARISPPLPLTANTASTVFNWTPTVDDIGAYSITFTAEDVRLAGNIPTPNGNFTFTSVQICVIPPLQIIEPNGGEAYFPGNEVDISWEAIGCPRPAGVRIELSRDGGLSFTELIAAAAPDTGRFTWTVTAPQTRHAKIRIVSVQDPTDNDVTDGEFSIIQGATNKLCTDTSARPIAIPDNEPVWTNIPIPFTGDQIIRGLAVQVDITHPYVGDLQVAVVHPDSGALLAQGMEPKPEDMVLLHRQTETDANDLRVVYGAGRNFTAPVESLTKLYGRTSKGTWYLRVRDLHPGDIGTLDRWCLTVTGAPRGDILLTSPRGGERWAIGLPQTLTWDETGVTGLLNVELSRDEGKTWEKLGQVMAGVRKLIFTPTGPEAPNALIRVSSDEEPAVAGTSRSFSILNPFLRVLSPNGGEVIPVQRPFQITWEGTPASGSVTIELSQNGGRTYPVTITNSAPDNGTFQWTPTAGLDTTQGRIRIRSNSDAARFDVSDRNFTIETPSVHVSAPNGGEVWFTHTPQTIRWETIGVEGPVRIELFRNGQWENLVNNTPNDGTETVTFTGGASPQARIRISAANQPDLRDESDQPFQLREMSVRLLTPNGGEEWGAGTTRTIVWSSEGVPGTVDLEISRDGQNFTPLFTGVANTGRIDWLVEGPATETALIRVRPTGLPPFDVSDQLFRIVQPAITVVSPNGGEELRIGKPFTFTWRRVGVSGNVRIDLIRDGETETLFANTEDDGSQVWTPTGPDTLDARIQITSLDLPSVSDTSDGPFSIVTPKILITSPVAGDAWTTGTAQEITWTSNGFDGNVRIELLRDGANSETLFDNAPNNGTATWNVSGRGSRNARIRITSLNDTSIKDESDPFTIIQPALTVGRPNGGETWMVGTEQAITWGHVGLTGDVRIELIRNGAVEVLFPSVDVDAGNGQITWIVEGPTNSAQLRIVSLERPEVSDTSDRTFRITTQTLIVTAPGRGARWSVGSRQRISWRGEGLGTGTVDVQLSRNGGRSYQTIIPGTGNDGAVLWNVSGALTRSARVRVVLRGTRVNGVSQTFTIQGRSTQRR